MNHTLLRTCFFFSFSFFLIFFSFLAAFFSSFVITLLVMPETALSSSFLEAPTWLGRDPTFFSAPSAPLMSPEMCDDALAMLAAPLRAILSVLTCIRES